MDLVSLVGTLKKNALIKIRTIQIFTKQLILCPYFYKKCPLNLLDFYECITCRKIIPKLTIQIYYPESRQRLK